MSVQIVNANPIPVSISGQPIQTSTTAQQGSSNQTPIYVNVNAAWVDEAYTWTVSPTASSSLVFGALAAATAVVPTATYLCRVFVNGTCNTYNISSACSVVLSLNDTGVVQSMTGVAGAFLATSNQMSYRTPPVMLSALDMSQNAVTPCQTFDCVLQTTGVSQPGLLSWGAWIPTGATAYVSVRMLLHRIA